jgi:putative endonuclease
MLEEQMVDRSRQAAGAAGERRAALEYRRAGFAVLDRNWRVPFAEIDLIVGRDGLVVIVEVKLRRGGGFGGPLAAVGPAKQRRLRDAAALWLAAHPEHAGDRIRFDVVAIEGSRVEIVDGAF